MIIATFSKVPILINFLSKYDYITFLEAQVAKKIDDINNKYIL